MRLPIRPYSYLIAIAALALAWRFYFIYRDLDWLTNYWLFDDFGYSLKIARNIALGLGETFDGQVPTSGYQPLYVWLAVPVFALADHNIEAPLYVILTGLAFVNVGTGYVGYLIVRHITNNVTFALAAFLYWSINLAIARNGTLGLETGLSTFLLSIVVLLTLKADWSNKPRRQPWVIGGALGMAFLARIDAVFVVPSLVVALLAGQQSRRTVARNLLSIAVAFLAIAGPYLLWNNFVHGGPLPESGAVTRGTSDFFNLRDRLSASALPNIEFAFYVIGRMLLGMTTKAGIVLKPSVDLEWIGMLALVSVLGAILLKLLLVQDPLSKRNFSLLALSFFSFIFAYSVYHHGLYERYHLPAVFLWMTLFFSALSDIYHQKKAVAKLSAVGAATLSIVSLPLAAQSHAAKDFHWSTDFKQAAGWKKGIDALNEITNMGDVVAGHQAGNLGYFYKHGRAVNLDGVVNGVALRYKKDRKMDEYFSINKIKYYADESYWSFLVPNAFIADKSISRQFLANMRLRYGTATETFRIFEIEHVDYAQIMKPEHQGNITEVKDPGAIDGYYLQTARPEEAITFPASGCFDLKLVRDTYAGIVEVRSNNRLLASADLYSPFRDPTFILSFNVGDNESIVVRPTGSRNPASRGSVIGVDAVMVRRYCK